MVETSNHLLGTEEVTLQRSTRNNSDPISPAAEMLTPLNSTITKHEHTNHTVFPERRSTHAEARRKPKAGRGGRDRDQEKRKKKEQSSPQITGYPGPSGGRDPGAHRRAPPRSRSAKGGRAFFRSPPRERASSPAQCASTAPHPTRQQGQQRRAPRGDTLVMRTATVPVAQLTRCRRRGCGVVVLRLCCRRLGRIQPRGRNGRAQRGQPDARRRGLVSRGRRDGVAGRGEEERARRWWTGVWEEEEEEKRNWKLGMAGKHAFKLPPAAMAAVAIACGPSLSI